MTPARAVLSVACATALLGLTLLPAPAYAAGGTVYVDDDWAGTPPGDDPDGAGPATAFGVDAFAALPDALAAAPARVEVGPGDYRGQLVIDADVELVGAGEADTFLTAPASPGDYLGYWGGVNGILVVDGARVTVTGVTIRGPQPGVPLMVGALVGGGGTLELSAVTIRDIRDDPFGGAQRGVAVLAGMSGGGTTGDVTLRDVVIEDYQKLGVVIRPGSTATIEDTVIRGMGAQCVNGANGIQVQGAATIRRTEVRDNRYADAPGTPGCSGGLADGFGIAAFDPTGPVHIEDSTLSGNETGIYLSAGAGPGAAVTVTGTTITGLLDDPLGNPLGDTSWGIVSDWQRDGGALISGNTVRRTSTALELAGGHDDVTSNAIRDNALGVMLHTQPQRLAANAIVGNDEGLRADAAAEAGPNWWGCDEGPGASGCDATAGAYTEPAWLVLSLEIDVCTVQLAQTIPAVARLTTTSTGSPYTDTTVPATEIALATNGLVSVTPASGTTLDGELPVTLRGISTGAGTAEAHADNGYASVPGAGCSTLTVTPPSPKLPGDPDDDTGDAADDDTDAADDDTDAADDDADTTPTGEGDGALADTGAATPASGWALGTLGAGIALILVATRHGRRGHGTARDYARGDG